MYSYVVYVDEVFLGNLIINLVVLWATSRLVRIEAVKWRLFSGAFIGALYSIALFVPLGINLFGVIFKFSVSVLIILVTFGPKPVKNMAIILGYFYFTSFAMGGVVFGAGYFLNSHGAGTPGTEEFLTVVRDYFWYGILLAIIAIYMLAKWGPIFWRRRVSEESFYFPLDISFGQGTVALKSFLDTGNHLSDPLTGYPVVVVEYDSIKHMFPGKLKAALSKNFENENTLAGILDALPGSGWEERFKVIPFHSVGNTNGLLYGFSPDKIELKCGEKDIVTAQVIIGLCKQSLSSDAAYHALLPPGLFDNSD